MLRRVRVVAAVEMAICASSSAVGCIETAQSENIKTVSLPSKELGITMMKQLDTPKIPSANPIVRPAASMTRAVAFATPATQPSLTLQF